MNLYLDSGGWVVALDDEDNELAARFGLRPDGRLVMRSVRWTPSGPVTAVAWRQVPIAQLETEVNAPDVYKRIVAALNDEPSFLFQTFPREIRELLEETRIRFAGRTNPRIPHPAKGNYGDQFYERVARYYRWHVSRFEHRKPGPAQALAEANDVEVTTAHRWIKEARRRGFLGAGTPGRAG